MHFFKHWNLQVPLSLLEGVRYTNQNLQAYIEHFAPWVLTDNEIQG